MLTQEKRLLISQKIRVALVTILVLSTFELLLGKILDRIILAPDLGLVLFIGSLGLTIVASLRIGEMKRGK